MKTLLQSDQFVNEAALPVSGQPARSPGDEILPAFDKNADTPLRLHAAATPDSKVYFEASQVFSGNTTGKAIPPINNLMPVVVASTFDLQTQAGSGATFTGSVPVTTVGQFRRIGFILLSSGTIFVTSTNAAASVGSLENPQNLFDPGVVGAYTGQPLGWVDAEATAATAFKTAGSATSIVENSVSGISRIFVLPPVGLSSSGGSSFDVNTIVVDDVTGDVLTASGNVLVEG